MGLLDDIFRPVQNKGTLQEVQNAARNFATLTAYRPSFTTWGGAIYESELVRAAIDARARHISKLKVEIYGSAKPALQAKLKQGPNQWQTYSQFLYRASTILDCTTTCIIVPVFDADLNITGYYPVLPRRCQVVEYEGEPWLRYEFAHGQRAATPLKDCAVLTKFQYKNDIFGDGNEALTETMKLVHLANQGVDEAIKSSATFRFMARTKTMTKTEDLAKERKRFNEANLSASAEGDAGLLLFPSQYEDIKLIDPRPYTVDADQMKLIRENVSNYFGVNTAVLQNAAIGDAWAAFYEGAVEPFAIQFSEAMTKAVFTERERSQGSYIMATANRLQYLSNSDKLQVSAQMADRGIMTINEIRDIWNLAPVEGGDVAVIRGEYYTLDDKKEGQENGNETE
jgi:HK97 family phage portal protein